MGLPNLLDMYLGILSPRPVSNGYEVWALYTFQVEKCAYLLLLRFNGAKVS